MYLQAVGNRHKCVITARDATKIESDRYNQLNIIVVSLKFCSVASLFCSVDTALESIIKVCKMATVRIRGLLDFFVRAHCKAVTHSGQSVTPDFFYADSCASARPFSVIAVESWPINSRSAVIYDGASFYHHWMTSWPQCFSVFLLLFFVHIYLSIFTFNTNLLYHEWIYISWFKMDTLLLILYQTICLDTLISLFKSLWISVCF